MRNDHHAAVSDPARTITAMRGFKYLRAEHAVAMVTSGRILLRPPRYFRELEERDRGRGDRNESMKVVGVVVHRPDDVATLEPGERRMLQSVFGRSRDPAADSSAPRMPPSFEDIAVIHVDGAEGALLYCMSSDASGRLHREFETDTIVEILDLWSFTKSVRAAAVEKYKDDRIRATLTPCRYVKSTTWIRPGSPEDAVDAYALKSKKFAHQAEVRIVLESDAVDFSKDDTHFLDIADPASVCRLYAAGRDDPLPRVSRLLTQRFGPNEPCPCGRGRKLKRCCG